MLRNSILPFAFLLLLVPISAFTPATDTDQGKTIILIRHAEKCTEPADNPGLTPLGQERALDLVRTLTDFPVDAIYSTPLDRTRDTVRPLSDQRNVDITETPIRAGFMEAMVESIRASDFRMIVVSGHSNTTPRVVNMLAGTDLDDLEETEYDRLYLVHLPKNGVPSVTILRYGPPSGPSESVC